MVMYLLCIIFLWNNRPSTVGKIVTAMQFGVLLKKRQREKHDEGPQAAAEEEILNHT